jgi:hypothetical protein
MIGRFAVFALAAAAVALAQDYKVEPLNSPPQGLPAAYGSVIASQGYRVVGPKGPWCEIWFRKAIPTTGAKSSDAAIVFPIAQGTLLGILRFPSAGEDRRGQPIKAGVYTMRYSNYPVDGAHQGVAPQRDFALLTPIANDADPAATPAFEALVTQSKTTGTAHAAVFSLEPPSGSNFPSINKEGEHDYALSAKAGDLPIAIIVAGRAE